MGYPIPAPPQRGDIDWPEQLNAGHEAQTVALNALSSRVAQAEQVFDVVQGAVDSSDAAISIAVATNGTATRDALTSSFRPKLTLDWIPRGQFVIPHHLGGANPVASFPPCSRSAILLAIARGERIIDLDVQKTRDGVFFVWHDTTTADYGEYTVTPRQLAFHQLPKIDARKRLGNGWTPEPMLSLESVFAEFGDRICFTIELKQDAEANLSGVAALVHKYGLADSVLINFSAPYGGFADLVKAQGLHFGAFSCTTVAQASQAVSDGAKVVCVPLTADSALIAAAKTVRSSGGFALMQGPMGRDPFGVGTAVEAATVRAADMDGYVADSLGYLEPPTRPIASSIAAACASGKAGLGWISRNPHDFPQGTVWLDPVKGVLTAMGGKANRISMRDLAGDYGTSYTIDFTVNFEELPETLTQHVGVRFACPDDIMASGAASPAHKGYFAAVQANGAVRAWKSNGTAETSLANVTSTALVAGADVPLRIEVTPTQWRLVRQDTGATSGWLAETEWRGQFVLTNTSLTTGKAWIKSLSIASGVSGA